MGEGGGGGRGFSMESKTCPLARSYGDSVILVAVTHLEIIPFGANFASSFFYITTRNIQSMTSTWSLDYTFDRGYSTLKDPKKTSE